MNDIANDTGLEELLGFLKGSRGFDFTGYKRSSLTRRLQRRMSAIDIHDFSAYRTYLDEHPEEFGLLFNSILINVTSFFRDAEAWGFLAEEVVPKILRNCQHKPQLKIWSAGCASGEEPFSIAMLFAEAMGLEDYCRRVKVYATDWDEEALIQARRARYTIDQLEPVPESLRKKYFVLEDDGATTLNSALRRSVIFGRHDLLEDSPISRLELLSCRNTLMYFNVTAQARILSRLHFALNDQGVIFLGRAEMLLSHTRYFTPIDLKHRVFAKVADIEMPAPIEPARGQDRNAALQQYHARLREAALDAAPVAQIIVDSGGRLAIFNQRAAAMFQLGAPEIGRMLQDLELSYRPADLRSLIDRARAADDGPCQAQVARPLPNGKTQYLEIQAVPLLHGGEQVAVSITFTDVTKAQELQENLQHFSENLETAYEELQSANEELETTNEELQSSNEELETTNEELQAANEEMETINEELRSTNEELQGANETLRIREADLNGANAFLASILGSLRAGVAVVGADGRVKVWNSSAEELWGMRADEVRGRLFGTLDIGLPTGELEGPIAETLRSGEPHDVTVDAVNRRGRRVRCHVTVNKLMGPEPGALTLLMELVGDADDR